MRLVESSFAREANIRPRTPTDEPIYAIALSQETAHGGTEETWRAMLEGRPLVVKEMDSNNHPVLRNPRTRYYSPLTGDPFSQLHPGDRRELKYFSRNAAFNVVHSRKLLEQVGLLSDNGQYLNRALIEPHSVAVMIGSGYGPAGASIDVNNTLITRGPGKILPSDASKQFPEQPNARVVSALRIPGAGVLTLAAACASGSQSLVMAYKALKSDYHLAIAGGVEVVADEKEDLMVASFTSFLALSQQNESPTRSSRPFDAKRDGFVAASAIGLMLLARASLVEKLKITPLAEVAMGAYSNDGSVDITKANSQSQASDLARMLLEPKTGKIYAPDVIWAHATSTGLGDRTEINTYKKVFGDLIKYQVGIDGDSIIIYGPKSVLAHSMGASGGTAAVTAVQAMRDRKVPFMPNLENPQAYTNNERLNNIKPDPDIPEDFFEGVNFSRSKVLELNHTPSILVGNQGFGSHNAYIFFKPV